ncbi:MAG: ribonuclease Z [Candidatus Thorarchaeota archaeon]
MEVVFLGTGGAIPTANRMHPAILVMHQGLHILLDAGEGTQIQFDRARIGVNKRMLIFITHAHADHCLGLPGLLLRLSLLGRLAPLAIYGPKELVDFVRAGVATINLHTHFETTVYPILPGHEVTINDLVIRSFEVQHHGPALGYQIKHERPTGEFLPERAISLGVPRGPLWRELASGVSIRLDDGRVVTPAEVTASRPSPIKIVYSGDSRPCAGLREAARSADLFICESMFSSEHQKEAEERGHMTGVEAAQIASECGVKTLVLTHLSPRYDLVKGRPVLEEARAVFPNSMLARDLMRLRVDRNGVALLDGGIQ